MAKRSTNHHFSKQVRISIELSTGEYNNQVRVEMKKMMEASKSPLC